MAKKIIGVRSSDVLGEKVWDDNGFALGKIKEIYIHPEKLTVEGITVRGLHKDDFVDKSNINLLTERGAILKVKPIQEYIGLTVLDARGKKVGKVKDVEVSKDNKLSAFIVSPGLLHKNIIVRKSEIKSIDNKRVWLKIIR